MPLARFSMVRIAGRWTDDCLGGDMGVPAPADIEEFEQLFRDSRFLDVHERLSSFDEPETWASVRARIIAARSMGNLGSPGRARRLVLSTWRREPAEASARYFMLGNYWERHGPIETLGLLDRLGGWPIGGAAAECRRGC